MTPLPTVSSLLLSAVLMALERNSGSEADPSPPTGPLAVLSSPQSGFVNLSEQAYRVAGCGTELASPPKLAYLYPRKQRAEV